MTRDGLTEENLRDGSVKDISHRSRGRPENKEEFVPERERKKAENEDSKSGKGKRLQMEKIRKSSVRQEVVEDTVEVTPEEKVSGYRKKLHRYEKIPDDDNNLNSQKKSIRKKQMKMQVWKVPDLQSVKQNVGVQKGSTAADAVDNTKELKDANIQLLADNVQILNDLGNGLDAAVMDEVVAKYYTKKDAGKYKVLEDSVTTEKYVIGFRKDDKALCKEVIKQLKAMAKDGTLKKISTKWFDEDITTIK